MFNTIAISQQENLPESDVLFIIKDHIFNGSIVDYITVFDFRTYGQKDPHDYGLKIVLHNMKDRWIHDASFKDIHIINSKNGKEIKLKEE